MKTILVVCGIALSLSASPAWSQQSTPVYGNETHQDSTPSRAADKASQGQKPASSSSEPVSQERMFGVLPAYGLAEAGTQPPPLTSGQKFGLAVEYFNPYTFLFVGLEAGINQASNSPKDYSQGAEGYGKRYGAGFVDGLTDKIFTTGVYPSLFHQDPRYYRLGNGRFRHRTGYVASRILVTRQDSGRKTINLSEILGSFTSSSIGVTYYPASQRDFSHVASRACVEFGFDAGFNVLKEFYPDIQRKFFGKKH
jgi:hypothetical protein